MPLLYDPTGEPIEIAEGRGDLRFSSVPFDFQAGVGGVVTVAGKTISFAELVATQPWVAAAVMRMLTWSVRVPLKAYRKTGTDSRERLHDHPLAQAIIDPWERGSQASLVTTMLGSLLVHGNGTTRILQGARDRFHFDPVDWRTVKPLTPFRSRISGWEIRDDGQTETISADEVVHLAWWSPLGPIGISPLQQLGVTIKIEEAAQNYQHSYLRQSARTPVALKLPDEHAMDPQERAELRADFAMHNAGALNAGRPILLPPGIEPHDLSGHNAHEAELIEQRKLSREEVASVYMIPPPMLGILDRATYANIQTQREMSYTDSLGPPLVLIEQTINAQLVRGLLREDDIYVEFDFAGVLRGDRLKEIRALREAIATGVLTPNEGRRAVNYPASDNPAADELYLPTNNLQPLGTIETAPSGAA